MFGLGPAELLVILVLVLFFYGGKRLPQIGDGLGRGIREFQRAIRGTENPKEKPEQDGARISSGHSAEPAESSAAKANRQPPSSQG